MRGQRQLDIFDRMPLCERLGFHVWAIDGANNCDCGEEVVGPWNEPRGYLPGCPISTCWDVARREAALS